MALINCPECGKEISNQSKQCIHCGFPIKNTICVVNGTECDLYFLLENIDIGEKLGKLTSLTNCDSVMAFKIINEVELTKKIPNVLNFKTYDKIMQQQKLEASKIHCPKCNSTAVTTGARGVNNFWGMLGASKTVNRCGNCGFTWKP